MLVRPSSWLLHMPSVRFSEDASQRPLPFAIALTKLRMLSFVLVAGHKLRKLLRPLTVSDHRRAVMLK